MCFILTCTISGKLPRRSPTPILLETSGASILVHSLLYFGLICLFLISIKVHFYIG
uniref:Uncharacterized protein n=1 Tax=Cajanus cajan TaxID=3821 RepID=A0A151RUF1_CAJCA|nr:hypothetical protein KK1_032263 [Cajanus cajan]